MKNRGYKFNKVLSILFVVILLAAFLRFYGYNWDQGQHLHPDERFLTMVALNIKWPQSISEYFDTNHSPLNPHNADYGFFVYGTFPLFFVKALATLFNLHDYHHLTLLGRVTSAVFDLGTVILVFGIARMVIFKKTKDEVSMPIVAAFFYAISVLPIQLSHYFAVDTFLVFFITLSFYLLIKILSELANSSNLTENKKNQLLIKVILMGIAFGLALSCKISAILFSPILLLGFLFLIIKDLKKSRKHLSFYLISPILFLFFLYVTLRFAYPYLINSNGSLFAFNLNTKIIENWTQLKSFDNPEAMFPPGIQWITTKPLTFPLRNLLYYGLGLPLGLLAIGGVFYSFYTLLKDFRKNKFKIILLLILFWITGLFYYQGIQFVKAMRYFAPIYPFLAITAALFFERIIPKKSDLKTDLMIFSLLILIFLWPLIFFSIYYHDHSRVTASEWIYKNIPRGKTLSCEHWDDCLPVPLGKNNLYQYKKIVELPLYNPDSPEKWKEVNQKLAKIDYLILSSNRLYGSIASVPERYPETTAFYQKLFNGQAGFRKIAEFTSRPNLPFPFFNLCLNPPFETYGYLAKKSQACDTSGLSIVDDYTDESFTVYDHPKVIIFQKIKN